MGISSIWKKGNGVGGEQQKRADDVKKINIRCVGKPQEIFSPPRRNRIFSQPAPVIVIHSPGKTKPHERTFCGSGLVRDCTAFYNLIINEPQCRLIETNLC